MGIAPARKFIRPLPNDDWASIASREFPDEPAEATAESLQSWNFHVFMRPAGANGKTILPSDIVFTEAPKPVAEA
jgi:hypothetical protein